VLLGSPDALRATAPSHIQRHAPRHRLKGRQSTPEAVAQLHALIGPPPEGGHRRDLLIEHLHAINDHFKGLPEPLLVALAADMRLGVAEVYEVASFYHHFEVLPDGQTGELVFTTITKEGIPMVRYRTRDLTRILPGGCPCGRTGRRMSRVMGRTDDMLIIRGVNVFPSQIEAVLVEIEGTAPHYQIIVDRKGALDEATVLVEAAEHIFFDQMRRQREVVETIKKRLAQELGLSVEVKLVEKKTLARFEGKAKRVIDNRTL